MKAFNRNFILMIIGQIISLFGNAILRFSLSLYVLQVTSSASIFATILAVSILPTILLSPFGGILADRVSRRSIMLNLDFLTSFLIFGFSMVSTRGFSIVLVAILMISLSIIQAFYQPSVQASIPLLVSENQLMQGKRHCCTDQCTGNPARTYFGRGFLFFPSAVFSVTEYFRNCLLSIRHPGMHHAYSPFSGWQQMAPCSPSYAVTVA